MAELSGVISESHRIADALRTTLREARAVQTERERELTTNTQNRSNAADAIAAHRSEAQRLEISLDSASTQNEQITNEQLRDRAIQLVAKEAQSVTLRGAISTASQQAENLRQAIENLESSFAQPELPSFSTIPLLTLMTSMLTPSWI